VRAAPRLLSLTPSPFPLMAILQAFQGDTPSNVVPIPSVKSVLGRHPDCDIVLDAAAVSRQHAQITTENGQFFIEDLHSRNGTIVNSQLIQGRHLLASGDRIKICDLSFVFYLQDPRTARSMPGPEPGTGTVTFDDDFGGGGSTIMTKLDLAKGGSGRLSVNPETKLRAMIEITQSLARTVALEDVLPKLLDGLFKIFSQADRGFVILRQAADGPLVTKAIKHRRSDQEERVRISRTIINEAMASKEAILSADASNDARFDSSQSIADLQIRSVMCAPLINGEGAAVGVIQLDTMDQRQRFQKDDLDVLASIATQAAVAIDNAQLHEVQLVQRAVTRDLELAHKVQRGLLPPAPPKVPGYHFFDFYDAASQVGGDYYDYVELSDGRVAIVLGDVSGKGVSAALVMAKLSGEVRFDLASAPTAAEALNRINASFCRSGWEDRFVTFVIAILDPAKHELTVANAGHMAPLLRTADGEVTALGDKVSGWVLGVSPSFEYEQTTHKLNPGDTVTLFTDGISEAMNEAGDLYTIERLTKQLALPAKDLSEIGRQILSDVKRFVGSRSQSDDMCLACFGRGA
jgi:sigma-B regulation protein RsbU (phosphoserine phosphatase)